MGVLDNPKRIKFIFIKVFTKSCAAQKVIVVIPVPKLLVVEKFVFIGNIVTLGHGLMTVEVTGGLSTLQALYLQTNLECRVGLESWGTRTDLEFSGGLGSWEGPETFREGSKTFSLMVSKPCPKVSKPWAEFSVRIGRFRNLDPKWGSICKL
ncbi:hypothetical protein GQ457_08G017330 [Hibiscus cannabinus]